MVRTVLFLVGSALVFGCAESTLGAGDGGGGNGPDQRGNGDGGCGLRTCESAGASCGLIGDGCGSLIQCGTCAPPQTCGGGGTPSACGGASGCVPLTCTQLQLHCGPAGDGCGNVIPCGDCMGGETCGGGGVRGQCGAPMMTLPDAGTGCVPHTCGSATCGQVGDGCGGLLDCGTCSSGTCGGGGTPFQCGSPSCTPKSCGQLGYNCGQAGDGCGALIQGGCGSCSGQDVCGALQPNVCGNNVWTGGMSQCDGGSTTITGKVVAPTDPSAGFGQPDPIYNATVYVPSGAIQPITTGATCDQCTMSQPSLVSATTGIDGTFTLTNPPTGQGVKVVIQLGKWRRVLTLDVTPCTNNALTIDQTRLPRRQAEIDPNDNIPRFAVDTGGVDVVECVLRKIGIADTEFTNPGLDGAGLPQGAERVHLYQGGWEYSQGSYSDTQGQAVAGGGGGGARINGSTPPETSLFERQATLNAYDAILFPCPGTFLAKGPNDQQRVINYTEAGGRAFFTHWNRSWIDETTPWPMTAAWTTDAAYNEQFIGFVDQSFPKGVALANWLQSVGASSALGQIPVDVVRRDFNQVLIGQQWLYSTNPPNTGPSQFPLHYTFNMPVGVPSANQCGRVVYSDFHVENYPDPSSYNLAFPTECSNGPLTPQEKLLEFMLFDLTSCVQPDVPTCTPKSCAALGFNCGMQGDGCGGTQDCGSCPMGQTCGGGGVPGRCGGGCTPSTCNALNLHCGSTADGCGGMLDCGSCPPGQTCGGGGMVGQCGAPPDMGVGCVPLTCADLGLDCGPAGDGCGRLLQCGDCPPGQTCGGGGVPGKCGAPSCTPVTCQQAGAQCGWIGDGCGGAVDCGPCPPGFTCGGGGIPNVCNGIP